jgi:hypothetical protein
MALFPYQPNGLIPVRESRGYLTDLMQAKSGKEQRRQLRGWPRRSVTFSFALEDLTSVQALQATIYRLQGVEVTVPLWQYASPLTAAAAAGAGNVYASYSDRPFYAGGTVALWASLSRYESLTASSFSASGGEHAVLSGTVSAWTDYPATSAVLMPAEAGWIEGPLSVVRVGQFYEATLTFRLRSQALTFIQGSDTTATLSTVPDGAGDPADVFDRPVVFLGGETGATYVDLSTDSPASVRRVFYPAYTFSGILALLTFLDQRRGRAVPFYLPTWDQDMTLWDNHASGESELRINAIGYTDGMFPLDASRRHIAIFKDGTIYSSHKIMDVLYNPGDTLEYLTIDPVLPQNYAAANYSICFLRWSRLESDSVDISFPGFGIADCDLQVREIPIEAAA